MDNGIGITNAETGWGKAPPLGTILASTRITLAQGRVGYVDRSREGHVRWPKIGL